MVIGRLFPTFMSINEYPVHGKMRLRKRTGQPPSYAEAMETKSLALHIRAYFKESLQLHRTEKNFRPPKFVNCFYRKFVISYQKISNDLFLVIPLKII